MDENTINGNLYLCNPQTKQWVALPPVALPPYPYFSDTAVGLLVDPEPCSFCRSHGGCGVVDNSRYKFVVMRIHFPDRRAMPITDFQVQIFSSVQGQWLDYVVPWTIDRGHSHYLIVPHKGKLHWLIYPYLVVFDPYNTPGRISRLIDLQMINLFPRYPDKNRPIFHNIGVFNDRLRVGCTARHENPGYYFIWELEDYDKGKWRLVQKLCRKNLLAEHVLISDGDVVCFENDSSATCLCNFRSDGVMDENKYELIPRGCVGMYGLLSVLIVDQWWPTPIPSLQPRT